MTRKQVHCHGAESRCCLFMPKASSFALPPSNASGCLGRSLYWLSHQVELIHNEWNPSNQKKNYRHHLHIRATLTCFSWSWRQFSHPLWWLNFCFNIIDVHPSFITRYDIFQKVFINIRMIKELLRVIRFSFCASVSRRGTNFVATRLIFSLLVKIWWHKLLQIPTSSATSQTVR